MMPKNPFHRPNEGPDGPPPEDGETPRRAFSWIRQRPRLVLGVFLAAVAAITFGCWLGYEGVTAKSNLEQARTSAQQAKDALLQGNAENAIESADTAVARADAARAATRSLPWRLAAMVPWLGSPFESGAQIADVVFQLADEVLRPSAEIGVAMSPNTLLTDGRFDVVALKQNEPELMAVAESATQIESNASSIADPAYLSILQEARSQLRDQTADVAALLRNTALVAQVAPSMMGLDGPRTYFMAFQTNAEARGTGGLLGGFGILRFDNGTPSVDTLASNIELIGSSASIDLGPEYVENFGFNEPTVDFRNSNMSSHFPYAAQIWKSMWEEQSTDRLDGVLAIDPVALSYILGAVGAVTLPDGEVVTKDNVVELTESTAYIRFPNETDQLARKKYLQDIASLVVKKMTGHVESPQALFDALGKAVSERRISLWSASPEEQSVLEQTPIAHVIPDDPAPYAEVVVNNLGGNKLDYYLRREIEYAADGCEADTRLSTVTVRLTNEVPDSSLPAYITGAEGVFAELPIQLTTGTALSSVRLNATMNATLVSAVVNGETASVFTGTERGHPSFEMQVAIPPGKTAEITFRLSEPTVAGEPRVPVQPLVDTISPAITVPECST